jgi:hypothetical protein
MRKSFGLGLAVLATLVIQARAQDNAALRLVQMSPSEAPPKDSKDLIAYGRALPLREIGPDSCDGEDVPG